MSSPASTSSTFAAAAPTCPAAIATIEFDEAVTTAMICLILFTNTMTVS